MARVADKMQEIGAKMVLVGDPDQLQPIEAGTPFRDFVARHGASQLHEVHRQTHHQMQVPVRNRARFFHAMAINLPPSAVST